jgi:hypothetical protein
MTKASVLILSCIAFSVLPADFSSEYTGFDNCKWVSEGENGGDGSQECEGLAGYYVFEYYSAGGTIRKLQQREKTGFEIGLWPIEALSYNELGQKIEWRCYGGKPFAIIYRIKTYENMGDKNYNEFLIIRGLDGFASISGDINTKKTKDSNIRARAIADSLYRQKSLK